MTSRHPLPILIAVVAAVVVGASPVEAHEGRGVLTVEEAAPVPENGIRYVVRLTWEDDGHAALSSTITATPIDGSGTPATPVAFRPIDEDGRYEATVRLPGPGTWTVRLTSVTPTAKVERLESLSPDPTVTSPTPSTTTTASTVATSGTDQDEANAPDDEDEGNGGLIAAGAAGVLTIVVAVGFGWFVRPGRNRA